MRSDDDADWPASTLQVIAHVKLLARSFCSTTALYNTSTCYGPHMAVVVPVRTTIDQCMRDRG